MSIYAEYVLLSQDEFHQLIETPSLVQKFLGHWQHEEPNREWREYYDRKVTASETALLWGLWQGVYYLLTGEVADYENPPTSPLANLFFGKHSVQFDGYEEVKYLTPADVQKLVPELGNRSPASIVEEFQHRPHDGVVIYRMPAPSEWGEFEFERLVTLYEQLRRLYENADKSGAGVLVSVG